VKNYGIIGCGDVAHRTYIPGVLAIADRATVTATYDPVLERAQSAAAKFPNATAYTTFEAFLAHPGLDAVFNLTPPALHRPLSTQAFDAGLHVFTEKPVSTTVEDAEALLAQAERTGKLLMCAPAVLVTGRFRWLKQVIEDGRIGPLHLAVAQMATMGPAGWRGYTGDPAPFYTPAVGPNIDLGVYVLHAITGLFGPAKRIQAFGGITIPQRKVLIERLAGQTIDVASNDVLMMHLDFGENRLAQVLATFAVPASNAPTLELHGSLGTISFPSATWWDSWAPVDIYRRDDTLLGMDGWLRNAGSPNTPEAWEHMIMAGPRHLTNVLEGVEEPVLTARHAIHVLEIMQSATRSATEGGVIELTTTF
jgi:predicted dehydrogenase